LLPRSEFEKKVDAGKEYESTSSPSVTIRGTISSSDINTGSIAYNPSITFASRICENADCEVECEHLTPEVVYCCEHDTDITPSEEWCEVCQEYFPDEYQQVLDDEES